MNNSFPLVPLDEFLTPVSRQEDVILEKIYPILGSHWYAKGLYIKDVKPGSTIQANKIYRVEKGDFVYNRLFAWKGSFAIALEENHNCYVSNEFPCFEVNQARVDSHYLWQYFSRASTWNNALDLSSGGTPTSRNRLKEEKLLGMKIPLPPLEEQQHIVARIEELSAKIEEARGLKRATLNESMNFWKVLSHLARNTDHPIRALEEMVEFLDGRRIPLSETERSERKGPYPYYGASGIIDYIDDYIFDEKLLLLSEDGANLINRSTPIAFIATGKYWVNNHAHVLRPLPNVVDIRFLEYALSDHDVSIFNFATAQAKLNQSNARRIAFPLPPLSVQLSIVNYLDTLKSKLEPLKHLQSETSAELDALLPSILDKAFKGEL